LDRAQLGWEPLDIERLIPADHPARIIWELTGKMELSRFEEERKSQVGAAGRPCWSPQLLVSVWVYGYTLKVASARAIERLMEHEPGLRWLTANQTVNYHTLADFRVGQKEALEELFAQFLALLEEAGIVDLSTILHDGTKVKAVAGRASFHRRKTLQKRLRTARKVVRELDRQAEQDLEGMDERRQAAQRRAAREAVERAEAALQQLKELEAKTAARQRAELRVSDSEPEARKMKQSNGGWDPSYNVQVSTEAQSRIIVAVGVTTDANDTQQLLPGLDRVQHNCGADPVRVIADNGYATRQNVEQAAERGVELIAPWKDDASRQAGACARNGIDPEFAPAVFREQDDGQRLLCPADKTLVVIQHRVHHGIPRVVFQAQARDCRRCQWRQQCCGNRGTPRRIERVVESKAMREYLARMQRRAVQALYKKRGEIAEFPYLWAKGLKHWRRFSVRGLVKAGMEALWVALAYNIAQWIRIRPTVAVTAVSQT
jgi:transposase